jgi:hypothetical protein
MAQSRRILHHLGFATTLYLQLSGPAFLLGAGNVLEETRLQTVLESSITDGGSVREQPGHGELWGKQASSASSTGDCALVGAPRCSLIGH